MSERPSPDSRNHHQSHGNHAKKPCSRIRLYNLGYFFSLSGLMSLCEIVSVPSIDLTLQLHSNMKLAFSQSLEFVVQSD